MHEKTGGPEAAVGVKVPGDPGDTLSERLEKLTFAMEKMNLAEYTALLQNPWRLLWVISWQAAPAAWVLASALRF
jgi:hypothetical protein